MVIYIYILYIYIYIYKVRLIADQGVCFIDYGSVAAAKVRSSPLSYDDACTRALSRSLTPTHSSLSHTGGV